MIVADPLIERYLLLLVCSTLYAWQAVRNVGSARHHPLAALWAPLSVSGTFARDGIFYIPRSTKVQQSEPGRSFDIREILHALQGILQ